MSVANDVWMNECQIEPDTHSAAVNVIQCLSVCAIENVGQTSNEPQSSTLPSTADVNNVRLCLVIHQLMSQTAC